MNHRKPRIKVTRCGALLHGEWMTTECKKPVDDGRRCADCLARMKAESQQHWTAKVK